MLLKGGKLGDNRILSEDAAKELSKRQTHGRITAKPIREGYGLGFAVGPDWSGHGGRTPQT